MMEQEFLTALLGGFFNPQRGEGVAPLACFDAISGLGSLSTSDDGLQH